MKKIREVTEADIEEAKKNDFFVLQDNKYFNGDMRLYLEEIRNVTIFDQFCMKKCDKFVHKILRKKRVAKVYTV